jgi:diacylglycerol kinase family enzyme
VLIENPRSTAAGAVDRGRVLRALGTVCDIEAIETAGRGHAWEIAAAARAAGAQLVVILGGDGTVNEAIQGLLEPSLPGEAPMLGVLPAGATNVFARAIGLPNDVARACATLVEAVWQGRTRVIGLGKADDRWFTFAAGFGLDAAVVGAVERRRRSGAQSSPILYARASLRAYRWARLRGAQITLSRPGHQDLGELAMAVVTNTAPWTYLYSRPLNPTPQASFDSGLDVYARSSLGALGLGWAMAQISRGRAAPRGRGVAVLHDVAELTLTASEPLPHQVDGDFLGLRRSIRLSAHPAALRVLC